MNDKNGLKCWKMIKKSSVEFCLEVPQNLLGEKSYWWDATIEI